MKFIVYLIGYVIYVFSFLIPRNKRIWIFGSFRGTFTDNAKFLFIYVSKHYSHLEPVWISYKCETVKQIRQKGLKAYTIFSLKGFYYALRGGYYFFNAYSSDICYFTVGRAICVNLWHGVGLKKIEFSIDRGPMYNRYVKKTFKERFYYPQVYKRPDYFLSSTDFQTVKFSKAFRINENQCLNIGYPRNDILLATEEERQYFISTFENDKTALLVKKFGEFNQVFLYMPTWRESQRNLFVSNLDLDELNLSMKANGNLLVLKPHANTIVAQKDFFLRYSHILLLDGSVDIYPLLPYSHVLITDYSSIFYDYLLMENKKIILYLYDYKEYVHDRDFNYPFLENVAGEIAYSFRELMFIISKNKYDTRDYSLIRKRFWGEYAGKACQEITDLFESKIM